MSQFDISIAKVRAAVAEIAAIAKQIKSDGQRISSVESRLNMNGSYTAELHSRLKELTETVITESSYASALSSTLVKQRPATTRTAVRFWFSIRMEAKAWRNTTAGAILSGSRILPAQSPLLNTIS